MPLVSIVIPTYNHARYLRQAIDSVLAQDHPRIELLVIDDGSTDDTRALLASYGTRFWWETQPNAGQTATINRGWQRAAGDLLGYLNADDVLTPDAVSASVAALAATPDAVMTYCDFALIDHASRETARRRLSPRIDLAWILRNGYAPFGPGSLVRRAAAEATAGWDPTLSRVPDFDFALRLARLGPFVHLPRVLSAFRLHEQSITFAAPPRAVTEESVRVIERFYAAADLPPAIAAMRGEALAAAYVSAAHGHLRARRGADALRCLRGAGAAHPRTLLSLHACRLVASGCVGQSVHRLRSRLTARRSQPGGAAAGDRDSSNAERADAHAERRPATPSRS